MALALAEQFALEQWAPDIEPLHILRGLASGGCGVGRTVLQEMGVDLFRLLPEIVELLPRFPKPTLPPIDALAADLGKYLPELELGTQSVACLEEAHIGAKRLNHNYLGTEHLVLGLISGQSPASTFLRARGVSNESFEDGVLRLLGQRG